VALLLAAAALAAFWPVLGNAFISYDDRPYVTRNPHVRAGLTWEGLRWAWTTGHAANWHPLTWMSHQLDAQLWGDDPRGHHATSLLLHLASTVTLFLVLTRMTGATGRSAVVAGLFAVHPLHVESVAWVAERKDVLSAFLWMLTMAAYARYVEAPGARRYAWVVLALAAGLLAKPMLVTLPFVLLLLDYWPLGRWSGTGLGKLVIEKLPLFALAAASSVVTLVVQSRGGSVGSFEVFPLDVRLLNAVVTCGAYLWQTVWPLRLAFYYPHPVSAPPAWQIAAAALVLLTMTAIALRQRGRRPWLLVGWLWYLGTLVPVIGLVQVGAQARADRYTYLPLVGIFLLAAWGLAEVASRRAGDRGRPAPNRAPRWVLVLVVAAFLPLVALANAQARRWHDSRTLYDHAIEVTGESSVVDNLVGVVLADEGRHAEAIPWYERAVRLGPAHVRARDNLGLALIRTGQPEKAIPVLLEAIRVSPNAPEPHNTLGVALSRLNRIAEAIPHFREALRLEPDYVQALTNLGTALVAVGSVEEGLRKLDEALSIAPRYAEAHSKMGLALARQGHFHEAIAHLTAAVEEEPANAEARQNLAMAFYLAGDYARAWEQVLAVRRLDVTPQPSLIKLLSEKMPEPRDPAASRR
jgi:protein O-mannosyl-transferase